MTRRAAVLIAAVLVAGAGSLGHHPSASATARPEPYENGNTRGIALSHSGIRISGGSGGGAVPADIPQCWYEPGYTPQAMAHYVLGYLHRRNGDPHGHKDISADIKLVEDHLGDKGKFWLPASFDTPAGQACMNNLRPWIWVPEGGTAPNGVTVAMLAEIARAFLTVPDPTIGTNPDGRSYVELPVWVWVERPGAAQRSVTATLPGVGSATLTARAGVLHIDSGTTADRATTYQKCGPAGTPRPGRVPAGPPDCGVVYHRSSADQPGQYYVLTATTRWDVRWAPGGGPVPPGGGTAMTPIVASGSRDIPVWEVQTSVSDSS